ncbi:hypothetical protein [Magnetovirga frankeli]|uniref:hypothetical protein n=1 Tax=Magnetovirga frankeli TaxID=947516 RepID=UPI003D336B78
MTYGWDERNPFDLGCRSDNFLQFIENMLAGYPGFYSKGLIAFVGKGSSEIDFIGRYENLVEDLISALRMAGEGFDESIIRQMPPFNVSNKSRFPAEYRAELRQRVTETEQETMERFGY